MDIHIQEMKEDDREALRELYLLVRNTTFTWVEPNRFREGDFDKETEGEIITVAFAGELVIGFISVWEPESFIHHLYVLPEYQNMGIGKLLLSHALETLDMPVRLKCLQKNQRALNFYKTGGWKSKEEGKDDLGEYALLEFVGKEE